MKDYNSIWIKWSTLFYLPQEMRVKVLDSLHPEVKHGFDVITKIGLEELEHNFTNKEKLNTYKTSLEALFAFSTWGGYMLFLVENSIDPVTAMLSANEPTATLGSTWIENYQKDQCKSIYENIDAILSILLDKNKEGRMNQVIMLHPDTIELPYKDMSQIEKFIYWTGLQGYVLAYLENQLNNNE